MEKRDRLNVCQQHLIEREVRTSEPTMRTAILSKIGSPDDAKLRLYDTDFVNHKVDALLMKGRDNLNMSSKVSNFEVVRWESVAQDLQIAKTAEQVVVVEGDGRVGCRERSVEVNSMHACGRVSALSGDWRLGQYTAATSFYRKCNLVTDQCCETV